MLNDSSTFDVTFGDWVHLAATYDNGSINYFLNGNPLDSDTMTSAAESPLITVVCRPGG